MKRTTLNLTPLEDRRVPAVATWDGRPDAGGAATGNTWTAATNWVGDVAPQPGDDLVFPAGALQFTSVNDFPAGTAFGSIRLTAPNYVITGNAVTLAAGVTADIPAGTSSDVAPRLGLDVTLAAPQTFAAVRDLGLSVTGAIDLNGHALTVSAAVVSGFFGPDSSFAVTLAGPVRGAGGLVKDGPGSLVLSGANTYTGPTDLRAGRLAAQSSTALGAAGAGNDTTVGRDAVLSAGGGAGGLLNIPEAITFAGQSAQDGAQLESAGATFSGPLTLAGPSRFVGPFTITAGVGEAGGPQSLTLYNAGVFAAGSVNTRAGLTTIEAGGARFEGNGPSGPVLVHDGAISGTGIIGPVTVGSSGVIAPGTPDGVGTLTTGDLILPDIGRSGLQITHLLADGRSDRVSVRGTVRLAGRLFVAGDTAPPAGTRYRIIDNDGTDPVVGAFLGAPEGAVAGTVGGRYLRVTYRGGDGNDVELVADAMAAPGRYAVAPGAGGGPLVNYYDGAGTLLRSFLAYDPAFRGGVRVATGDVTGDNVDDIVTAPGPGGGPVVRVWDGATGVMVIEFNAYDPSFTGGVFVAAGDTNGDFHADIVTGAGAGGGPHVIAFDGEIITINHRPAVQRSFLAYDPAFRGGVSVAAADINGDGRAEMVTGAGPGGGPHVKAFDTFTLQVVHEFLAYDPSFTGGVFVAGGRMNGDGRADIITAPGAGGGPHVKVFSGADGSLLASFLAYDPTFTGGVTVAVRPLGAGGVNAVVTGTGAGGGPHVEQWDIGATTVTRTYSDLAFDPSFTGGVFVG